MKTFVLGSMALALGAAATSSAAETTTMTMTTTGGESQQATTSRQTQEEIPIRRMKKSPGPPPALHHPNPEKTMSTGRNAPPPQGKTQKSATRHAPQPGHTPPPPLPPPAPLKQGKTNRHQPSDDWYDDFFDYNDDGGKGKGGYDDVYYVDDYYVDDYDDHYYDDYYGNDGKGKGKGSKKSTKSSKKGTGSGKGGKGDYLDDYYFYDDVYVDDIFFQDDYFVPVPSRPTLTLTGSAASPPALLSVVPDTSSPDPLAIGTVYLFGNTTYNTGNVEIDLIDVFVEGEPLQLTIRLDGYCTRTGTQENTVEGYCHFTYKVDDPTEQVDIGQFVAEGPLTNPNMVDFAPCANLQVMGGTGIFTGSAGIIEFCPSILNVDFSPPLVESLPSGQDLFEDVDAYLHLIDMTLDEEFVFILG